MTRRRLTVVIAIAVVVGAASLSGSGVGTSAAGVRGARAKIPAGLAAAVHARFVGWASRSSAAASAAGDPYLGYSVTVSADGTTALVGAPGAHDGKGAAYVFHVSDAGSWSSADIPTAVLTEPGSASGFFGYGVALSADGTTAFVSAPYAGTGTTYVFHIAAEDAWASTSTPTATLSGTGRVYNGLAVSPDGTTLAVGTPYDNSDRGRAYVFHVSSESAWVSSAVPTAALSNVSQNDPVEAGLSVAISADGTTVLVSASVDVLGHGGAYLYHVADAGAWTTHATPTAILSDNDLSHYDYLGSAVALSGDGTVAFLSAPGANSTSGEVDVFHASGEAAWTSTSTPTATLTKAGGFGGDDIGTRLAVSSDGTTALVTAYGVDSNRGAAYIFRVADEGSWASSSAPTATLTNSGAHANDELDAGALSSGGTTALLGAPGVRFRTGAAYAFHVADASSWATSATPNAKLTEKDLGACVVPQLKGLTLSAAKTALTAAHCRVGKVAKVHSTHKKKGRVLSQSRKAGTRLAIHAKVNVRVGK